MPMQPRMTIKPPELTTTPSEFGTKFTIQLCLPVDYTLNGILRILGPFKMEESITGGSIHIVGVTYASPGFDLNDANLFVTKFSDVHAEMALEYLCASSFDTLKRCQCLDILVVVNSPPMPASSILANGHFDVQLYSKTGEIKSTEVHFRISGHDHGIQPSFLLEDISSSTQLISGTTNTLALALRTLHAGVIKFDVSLSVQGPEAASEAATQILEISAITSVVTSLTITFQLTSDAFFEGVYPLHARISGLDKGIAVEPNCKPKLTRRRGEVLLTQHGITSTALHARITWNLYLQFSSAAPPRVVIDLATSIEGQSWRRSITLKFSNSRVVSIGVFPLGGIGTFLVTVTPPPFTLSDYALECYAEFSGSNERLPSRLKFSDWGTVNHAFPNVYSNRGRCSGNSVNFGKVFIPGSRQPSIWVVAELAVLADSPKSVQGSVTCVLTLDNAISQTSTSYFSTASANSSPRQSQLNPTIWTLQVLDVLTWAPLNRPLRSGEVALIAFEFTVPPNTVVIESPTIQIESSGDSTLDSPHVLAVGESVHWGDNYQNCMMPNDKPPKPNKMYTFNMGSLLAKGNDDSKVTVACYMRVQLPSNLSAANMTVKGTLGNHIVTTVIALSKSSDVYLGHPLTNDDISLSLVGPDVIEMMPNEQENLRLRFCTKPGTYLNDLQFEAFSEDDTYEEEVLTVNHLSYSASANYPGLQYATQEVILDRRKPSVQIWRRGTTLGPVFNSGRQAFVALFTSKFAISRGPFKLPNTQYKIYLCICLRR
ncbi:unnamed protein product [Mesocestoides corti]|uniref:Uncharacterized protein n=1 Tax=Mesocestoides corti TaxID=53468 RepID=A0A3P6GFP6_MESCO|nr:unnamed protein product [Mesocestoides corti]